METSCHESHHQPTTTTRDCPRVALVGSPNSGKTTLFNALTGSRQKTANYAGVTVEKKEGFVCVNNNSGPKEIRILDLPGTYSLTAAHSPDELITSQIVQGNYNGQNKPDVFVAIADSTNLATNLYLVLELKDLGVPVIVALTMSDLSKKKGIEIDRQTLEKELGLPVVLTSAVKKTGLKDLMQEICNMSAVVETTPAAPKTLDSHDQKQIIARYAKIEETLKQAVRYQSDRAKDISRTIDRVVLHRIFGPILLVSILALMFQLIFSFAQVPMNWIQNVITLLQVSVSKALPASWFQSLLVDGALAGVGAVIVFLPQILILFTFILFFEDSGYMARAAFIMDRLMGKIGLHGRAFIPLLSSFACAVPGIMATRTIENKRDRFTTIMVAPLMTCSARIPVYTVLIAAFIPATKVFGFFTLQGVVMLALYVAGVASALLVAFTMQRAIFKKEKSSFVMELPAYKLPAFKNIALGLWTRTQIFLRRAGTIILGVSLVLWLLASFPKIKAPEGFDEKATAAFQLEHSFAGRAGKAVEPILRPLGFDWKLGVGILASFAAREVVLSTLGTVYAVGYEKGNHAGLVQAFHQDKNFSLATALSLLVFYVLACQCISTLAVTRRETNSLRWPVFMFSYMTVLAFGASFVTYQLASSVLHS